MSDSESVNSHSDTSNSTIEAVSFENILETLQLAANDVKESHDYLSYSTVLDIYLADPSKYTYDEREVLLEHLYTILSEDKQLTYEIGWDLPSLLILYVDSDYDLSGPIRKAPGVHRILKLFEILAHNGNPKELFLKCNEVLATLKVSDTKTVSNQYNQERFFDIKLYCLFELIDSCLKRIKTYYPSRFLSMTVVSYINMIYQISYPSAANASFVMKRLYSFARNYHGLELPSDKEFTEEERAAIKKDEEYLQRKLLTGFVTESVSLSSKELIYGFALDLLNYLRDIREQPSTGGAPNSAAFTIDIPVFDRLYELSLSYDLDLDQIFKTFLVDAHTIFHTLDFSKTSDELSGEIFEKVVVDYQENLATSIVNSEAKQIRDSVFGCIILFTHHICTRKSFDSVVVTFHDALVMGLRTVIPYMVHDSFTNACMEDAVVFWGWYAIHQSKINGKNIELEIAKIPHVLLTIYYQVLLHIIISHESRPNIRYITLTLLTRVFSLSPQEVTFSFIQDSLVNCPYDNVKSALIGVLKELLTKSRDNQALDSIADELSSAGLDSSNKPKLPPRKNSTSQKKFLVLNEARLKFLTDIIDVTIDEVFPIVEGELTINAYKLSVLSSYLNLLVIIKDDPVVDKAQVLQLAEKVDKNCNSLLEKYKDDATKSMENNSCGILKVAIDRIKK